MDNTSDHSNCKSKSVRSLMKAVWVFSLFPLNMWITLWGLSVVAALLLGHWPQVSINDPKEIAEDNLLYGAFYYLAVINFWAFGVSVILAPVFAVLAWIAGSGSRIIWPSLLFWLGWLTLYLDPGQRVEWFMD